ncbi:DUF4245 domain-containing protein [Micrococcus porci]|uniref:DUF4245 domain-containing protein n=1 Tax=Micrococcus porci TaxID=2856555 RepID=UPI001CCB748C|nr:DUF4245 domain-containing protein [Micrococcus porci]UBH24524.1 DUF4245 domain-containing protein [Micrococcus porci]
MSSPDPAAPPAPRPVLTPKQAQRARAPWIAMVLSTLAVLGIVLVALMVNQPPPAPAQADRVDVAAAASTVPHDDGALPALAPDVPEPWDSTYARVERLQGVDTWDVGWAVNDAVFAGLKQTSRADPTWLALRVGSAPAVGTVDVDGITWDHYAPQDSKDQHLVAEVRGSTLVLTTSGDQAVLEDLARAVAKEIR